jgi:hypothetical protein
MAKCKQNPFLEGCRECAQDIQDVNVQGEGDCSPRSAHQSYEVKHKTNKQKCVVRYQARNASKNTLQEIVHSEVVKGESTL